MFFKDIIGKEELKDGLIKTVENGRIPHAQIFLGKEGSGSLALALAYASYITCENRQKSDSCGVCNQCLKSHKFIHPDIHFSYPVVKFGDKKRAETTSDDYLPFWRTILNNNPFMGTSEWLEHIGASTSLPNINVKECNDILHKLNMMSYESENKILIMWLPEFLGNEGNRLLKLIEEPTENTYIILVAENQDQILQTILSRCQLVKIPVFESEEIVKYLVEKLDIKHDLALQVANLADGNLNFAIKLGNNSAPDYSELLITWLRIAYKSDPIEINNLINSVNEMNKDEIKNFFEYGLHFFQQFTYINMTKTNEVRLTKKELEIASKMASIIDFEKSILIIDIINEAIENIQRNINIKIMLFADTLKIGQILIKK